MTSPVRAPQRIDPRRRPAPGHAAPARPRRRPELRVVNEPLTPRRRKAGVIGIGLTALLFACLFALALFQTMIVQGQQQLDGLDEEVRTEQARYEELRLQVARLESPERIVDEAVHRLGMVPPPGTTYLTPDGAVTAASEPAPADPPSADEAASADGWSRVKPYLP